MSAMIFHAIIRPLQEIEHAATHLVTAQRAELFSGSTNREFITLAHRVYEAARQIVGYRTELQEWAQTLEHRVTERTAELEMQNAELDAFAHTVAHDLKNPLSAMIASSSMLEICLDSMPQEKVVDTLRRITQTGYKMNNIINELMLLSSVRKMEDVDANPLDMGNIVTEAQTRLRDILQENQVEIVAPGEWPVVLGYGPWVEEVWANYISNAAKYGGRPDEGVSPTVELGFDAPNGSAASNAHVRFWVRDNGPGLTPEEQVEVFTPFTRLHQVRAEGHGLGLSIVRRIISRLGGEVGVESSFGQGSVFYFTLPIAMIGAE
jgi:signal transduction histidine kinase